MNDLDRLYVNNESEYFIAHDAKSYRLNSFIEDFNEFGSFECYHDIIINEIVDKYFRKLNENDQIELYTSLSEKDLSKYYKFPNLYDLAEQYIIEEVINNEEDVDDFVNDLDNYWITPQDIIDEYNSIKPSHHRIAFREYASDYAYQDIKRLLTIYDSKQLIQNKKFDVLDYALNFIKNHLSDFYYKNVIYKEEYETYYIFVENHYEYTDYYDMVFNTDYLDNLFNKPWIDIATCDDEGNYEMMLDSFIGDVDENKLYTFKNHKLVPQSIDDYMLEHYDAKLVEKESEDQ